MRRSWTISALILTCLALGGLPVLAQETPTSPVPATAGALELGARTLVLTTTTDLVELQDSTQTHDGDIVQARDLVWQYQHHATDPRLDGVLQIVINYDMRPDGSADMWGTETLTTDDGTWEGPWTGTMARNGGVHFALQHLIGSGSYEGLIWKSQTYFEAGPEYTEPALPLSVSTGWIEPVD